MIVDSMTLEEIHRQLHQDFDNTVPAYYCIYDRPEGLYCAIVAYKMGMTFIIPPHFFARYRERVIQDDSLSTSKENVHALCSNPHFRPILWNSPARLLNLYPVSSSEQYSMKKEEKINYEVPATIVIDVRTEGIICQSNGLNPMGDPEDL